MSEEANVCPHGQERVAGKCIPVDIKVSSTPSANSDVAIRRVLGFVKVSRDYNPGSMMFSPDFNRGYASGHFDALKSVRHILDESGFYSDEI